jgi:hypothetical protein
MDTKYHVLKATQTRTFLGSLCALAMCLLFCGIPAVFGTTIMPATTFWHVYDVSGSQDLGNLQAPFGNVSPYYSSPNPQPNTPWDDAMADDPVWQVTNTVDLTGYDLANVKYSIAIDNDYDLYVNGEFVESVSTSGGAWWSAPKTFPSGILRSGNNDISVTITDDGIASYFAMKITDGCDEVPELGSVAITDNWFTFGVSGQSNSFWNVYSSTDLTNWTLIGDVTLDSIDTSFTDSTITGVPYRFYKLSDSNCCSQAIGFIRRQVGVGSLTNGPGTNSLIANQLDAAGGNTLDGLFNVNGSGTMPDGTALPANSVIQKWDVPTQAYVQYTWDGSSWGGNGGVSLAPGEGAFLYNVGSGPLTVTFVGLAREGTLNVSLAPREFQLISSMVPKAGGLQADLGYIPAFPSGPVHPADNDEVETWNGSSFNFDEYGQASSPHWAFGDPPIHVGEAFFLKTTNTLWQTSFSACP